MRAPVVGVTVGVLLVLASACSTDPTRAEQSAASVQRDRVERIADELPAVRAARVQRAYEQTVMRVEITRRSADGDEVPTYTFLAGQGAWRIELPAPRGGGAGDGQATLLAVGDEICFDREFRPLVSGQLAMSYGVADFDPAPWTCTAAKFGLNTLATFDFRREDPRWRIAHLSTDPGAQSAEVEEDGEILLHLHTSGVTHDGPLDPARPTYDLWIDSDHLPVRMETEDLTWEFDYPGGDVAAALAAPPADRRGSYGYAVGPGQGVVKACMQSGTCPHARPDLTWGDGRDS